MVNEYAGYFYILTFAPKFHFHAVHTFWLMFNVLISYLIFGDYGTFIYQQNLWEMCISLWINTPVQKSSYSAVYQYLQNLSSFCYTHSVGDNFI